MYRRLILFAILSTISGSLCARQPREVKVLYWNIQNGMWADQGNNYDNFVSFVKSQNPDICVWAEAESRYRTGTCDKMAGCEEAYLPYNWDLLAARYGHKYVCLAGKRDTFPQVITSKYPIEIVKRINGNDDDIIVVHGAGWARIQLGKETVNIVTVHTWPQKYAYLAEDTAKSAAESGGAVFRSVEMKYICEQTILAQPGAENQHWMMLGDFNALSSIDNSHYKRNLSDKEYLVHDYIRNNTPYVDMIQKQYPDSFEPSTFSGKRIDFVYMTEPLYRQVTGARIIRDGYPKSYRLKDMHNFCIPSDHYPIVFTLRIK